MPENSMIRFISVLVVLGISGLIGYIFTKLRLRGKGLDAAEVQTKATTQARYFALLGVFIYLVGMVSIASLFVAR